MFTNNVSFLAYPPVSYNREAETDLSHNLCPQIFMFVCHNAHGRTFVGFLQENWITICDEFFFIFYIYIYMHEKVISYLEFGTVNRLSYSSYIFSYFYLLLTLTVKVLIVCCSSYCNP